jgi:Ser/Thr protein kinase RdoA (MazF antagonist)
MLTVDSAPSYLLARGLISHQTIIDGDLDITSITRRNANLRVAIRDRSGYLLKQAAAADDAVQTTIGTEARFYAHCFETPELAAVQRVLPRLLAHDAERDLLIVEFLEHTLPLWRYYRERTAERFPVEVTHGVGRLLGSLHHHFLQLPGERRPPFLTADLPWALQLLHPTPTVVSRMSAAHYDLIKLLQAEAEVVRTVVELRRQWRGTAIIHGDVKLDNFLVRPSTGDQGETLFLIDWELVQLGDPMWDVAGALQDFIFWWVINMPHDRSPDEMVAEARFPLDVLQPGIRAMWRGYCDARALDDRDAGELLSRAVRYSGVRILQTAAEIAGKYQTLPPPAVLMSQIGVNLLNDPEAGQDELYGLGDSTEA